MLQLGVVLMQGLFVGGDGEVLFAADAQRDLLPDVLGRSSEGERRTEDGDLRESPSDHFAMRLPEFDEAIVDGYILRHRNGISTPNPTHSHLLGRLYYGNPIIKNKSRPRDISTVGISVLLIDALGR